MAILNLSTRPNRLKCYYLRQLGIFMLCSIIASNAWAFSFMIREPQIHSILALTFPYQTHLGNSHVRLTDPKPHFYETSQEIGITLNLSVKDRTSGETIKARTMLRGGVHFDNQQQQLQVVKPKIVSLNWIGKATNTNHDLVKKQVTQLVGQDLPIIVLFDIKQLIGKERTPKLSDIKIKKQGIEISF